MLDTQTMVIGNNGSAQNTKQNRIEIADTHACKIEQ